MNSPNPRRFGAKLMTESSEKDSTEANLNGDAIIPRREKRAATRERIVQATIELLRQDGATALNTVNITRRAGIAQSGFYLHFASVDDAKRHAAERVAEAIRRRLAEQRRELHKLDPENKELLVARCRQMLEIFESERRFAEIFLHNRHDRSALGAVMRELYRQISDDIAEDWQVVFFRRKKLSQAARERIALQAEIIFGVALTIGEAIIENRIGDIVSAAELLAVNIAATTETTIFQAE